MTLGTNNLNEISDIYPAGYLQTGMLLEAELSSDGTYHDVFTYQVNKKFNYDRLVKIIDALIEKHELLRASFLQSEEHGCLVVIKKKVSSEDKIHIKDNNVIISSFLEEEKLTRFDYRKAGLYKFHILNQTSDSFTLVFSFHHAITDGWSIASLISELTNAYVNEQEIVQENLPLYGEFIREEQNAINSKKHQEFWRNYLSDYEVDIPNLKLNQSLDKTEKRNTQLSSHYSLSPEQNKLIFKLAKDYVTTVDVIFISLYQHLLSIFSNKKDITIGIVVNNRLEKEGGDRLFGLHLNTIPLRQNIGDKNVQTLLEETRNNKAKIYEYKSYPYGKLKSDLKLTEDIYQCAFNYVHFHNIEKEYKSSNINKSEGFEKTSIPLVMYASRRGEAFDIFFKGDHNFIDKDTIEKLRDYIVFYLEQLTRSENRTLKLQGIPDAEYNQVVLDWNKADKVYPNDKTIHQLFEEQAAKTPNNIAIAFEGKQLTYKELNEKSNQLARYIQKQATIKPDDLIALCLERSTEMIVGILGILKSGGAYVPIDPGYPEERINYIIEDTKTKFVLTQSHLLENLRGIKTAKLIALDTAIFAKEKNTNLAVQNKPADLAYVIYTSGTTGKPKGVLQLHENVHRLFSATDHQFKFTDKDTWTLYHAYTFDFSVWEIWGPLLFGGKLIIPNQETVKDIPRFVALCIENKVSVLNQTPSAFYAFASTLKDSKLSGLAVRYIIFGGEALHTNLLADWWEIKKEHALNTRLINMYGITETTVHVTFKEIEEKEQVSSNIGKAIDDLTAYVLDANRQPVPIGVAGELYIGGAGLARGYLNRPELTKERFIVNPFATKEEKAKGYTRLYKTGDLIRWLPDGDLEYLGRNDFQVKIRGYRIELGEIESALNSIEGIKQCCVLAKEKKNNKYLIAYYATEKNSEVEEAMVINQLSAQLPDYMIPGAFVALENFPLTVHGKLNRKALPDPEFTKQDSYVAPSTELEEKLCTIFQEVLNLEKVGVRDDFFRIGGDSIISIRVVSKIKKLGIAVSVRDIFTNRTIESLSKILAYNSLKDVAYQPYGLIDKVKYKNSIHNFDELSDIYPAGYLQTGMLLEAELSSDGTYHDVFTYEINKEFNYDRLAKIIAVLIEKHELLRASFLQSEEHGYLVLINKKVASKDKIQIKDNHIAVSSFLEEEKLIAFDYEQAGLYTFYILNQTRDSFTLGFSFHHAITDGWSIASLISELTNAYVNEQEIIQEKLPLFGEFIREEQSAIGNSENRKFWKNYLSDYEVDVPSLKLNPSFDKTKEQHVQPSSKYSLSPEQNKLIFRLAKDYATTADVIFISLYQHLLSVFFNKKDIIVGIVANNRLEKEGGDRLFGLHLNTIPLRQDIGSKNVQTLLKETRDNKAKVYAYKSYPYGKLKSDLNLTEDIYQCAFNYVHFHIIEDQYKSKNIVSSKGFEKSNIPLAMNTFRKGEAFHLAFVGDSDFVDKDTIERLRDYIVFYLEQLTRSKNETFELQGIPQAEYNQVVIDWNKTDKDYPEAKTIQQLFEKQVAQTPNKIAVAFEGKQFTYGELNEKSNQLARYIQNQTTVKPDTLIALCLDRSIEMIVGILGVLKSGGAYVPIAPEYPKERINYILEDTKAKLVLTQSHLVDNLKEIEAAELVILDATIYSKEKATNPSTHTKPTDLAYVIYTSGTTGKPKGVMVEHKNVLALLGSDHFNEVFNKRVLWTNYTFDVSVFEIFSSLCKGSELHILDNETRLDAVKYFDFIDSNGIETAYLPPFFIKDLSTYVEGRNGLPLRSILTGVDKIYYKDASNIINHNIAILNGYGPTETTVCSTSLFIDNNACEFEVLPIGKPINNEMVFVLDNNNDPVPIGVIGELYIGGAGLSRGYLNRPELTKEKFINNPFATKEEKAKDYTRLYKTGDLVRWLPNGNLEYIGRNDFQVKIRGYRIELAEVESALNSIEGIKQCCVLAKEKADNKYLAAYYLIENNNTVTEDAIITNLSNQLPDYMIPGVFVELESFPLTINGKLDRKAFPDPEFANQETYVAPKTAVEVKLSAIFQEVLHLDKIGMVDDFFRIGGNSILAIKLSHRISRAFDIHFPVANIFRHKKVNAIATCITSNEEEAITISSRILKHYPLSFAQERLWFFEQYQEGSNAYHIPIIVALQKGTDQQQLKEAIQQLLQRHEVLRTVLKKEEADVYYQKVLEEALMIGEYNYKETDITTQITKDINTPFNLEKEYPLRVCLYKEQNRTLLLLNLHHIAGDGWSVDILLKEIGILYKDKTLPTLAIQYKDYAAWQRDYLQGEELAKQLDYWQEQLRGVEPLALPIDKVRPREIDYSGDNVSFTISKNLSTQLRNLSTENGCTLYTTLLSGFYILLSKYTGQKDIVVGTPIAGRNYKEIEDLIGFFINSLALRENIVGEKTIKDLISQVQDNLIEAQGHQDLPFEKLVDELNVERDSSRHPVFQVMFGVQSFGKETESALFKPAGIDDAYQIAKFDLSCFLDDSKEEIRGVLNYATALYEKSTIERMTKHYLLVLDQMVSDKEKKIKDYNLLTTSEYNQILIDWNQTDKAYPKRKTIYQLFEEQVEKTPNNMAVFFEETKLTYKELNEKANQLARYIQNQTAINPDDLIALCLERSAEMIVAILGILKAGGAYVPINPNSPQERIKYILEDTKAKLVLTQSHLIDNLKDITGTKLMALDKKEYEKEQDTSLITQSKSSDLAYVIYTSGTTGKPKGVMVEQHAVLNLCGWHQSTFDVDINSRATFYANITFDAAVWEIWPYLLGGGCIYPLSDYIRADVQLLVSFLEREKITHVFLPTGIYEQFSKTGYKNTDILFLTGGDKLSKYDDRLSVVNNYGPTESTVVATSVMLQNSQQTKVPIGKPIDNTKVYVLDANNTPVPIGVAGELHIGGAGLARNYLNRPELSKEKFITNPFATKGDKAKGYTRLYKTGDLVRWLADGNLEYIGRNDSQVKIRGYRIELAEIELAFNGIAGIKQCCVLAKEKAGNKYLAAYYLVENNSIITKDTIVTNLSNQLPDYMVPGAFVEMESFPLTVNGKLDRKAFPDPEFTNEETYVAPKTEVEVKLSTIFQEVLGLDKVGVRDNFFRIGGNSILAIKLSHRIIKALDVHRPVADIFRYPTIEALAAFMTTDKREVIHIAPQVLEHYPLSFAQERLWFIEQYQEGSNAYHIPIIVELQKGTNEQQLKKAIQQLLQRHEVLRTVFQKEEGDIYYQKVQEKALMIGEYNYKETDIIEQITKDINTPFNLENEYPLRVCLYKEQDRILLLFNLHHIAGDGWSMDILLRELGVLYNGNTLPPLTIQYKDYAAWQRDYLQGEELAKQLTYWSEKLQGIEPLPLPTDKARPREIDYSGDSVPFTINKDLSTQLRALSKAEGCTLYVTLLSGFYILLSKYTAQEDIVVGTPVVGRNYQELEDLVGFFTHSLALREHIDQKQTAKGLITQVQHNLIEAQRHRDLPFEKLVEELNLERDSSRHPIFQVMFGVHSFGKAVETENMLFKPARIDDVYQVAKFDLNCSLNDSNETIRGLLNYATALYEKSTIEQMIKHYLLVLGQMVRDKETVIKDYSLLTKKDQAVILNANKYEQPSVKQTLVGMCLSGIESYPDNLAVIDKTGTYTYGDIGKYSYNIASYLQEHGLSKRNHLIAILSEKGYGQVVSTLGIMQSGAAYLPLHVDWPLGRINSVLTEGGVRTILVSQAQYSSSIQGTAIESNYKWLIIEELISYEPNISSSKLPLPKLDDIAYVIFTSGSTGKPKGVTISHRGAANTIEAVNAKFAVGASDKILALSELSFDLSVYDLFGLLAVGGTIVFPEQEKTKEPGHWYDLVSTHGITVWDTVPQLMQLLVDYARDYDKSLDTLRVVMMSGDWIPVQLPNEIKSCNASTTVMSLGGATEGSIWSIWHEVNEVKSDWTSIPYGQAMPNQKMYVLNESTEHCPVGVTGEIHIGGEGVALGYWNDEEKTKKSFIEDGSLGRLYKTGDLGKWHEAGYIEFQGRKDNQVKLNGYRVELEEISCLLANLDRVEKALVRVHENRLLAYLVLSSLKKPKDTNTFNENSFKAVQRGLTGDLTDISSLEDYIAIHLKDQLPDYMIPSDYIVLDSFPLTENGKLNLKALPEPEFSKQDNYVAPSTVLEEKICTLFQEVLNLEKVGATDDFFRIGGNSILAIKLSHGISHAFDNHFPVADIFRNTTVVALANHVESQTTKEEHIIIEL